MPSYLDVATRSQLWDVAHFVRSLARAPSLREAAVAEAQVPPGSGLTPKRRGEYLATAGTCFLCHAQMQPDGRYVAGSFGAGGMRITITYVATAYSRNLTPDRETGLGGWTPGDFRRALREGTAPHGRRLSALDMPWTIFAGLTDADADALHAYFQSVPPVRNSIPAPEMPSLVDGVARKAAALATGAAPEAGAPTAPVTNPRTDLWLALGCLTLLVVHASTRGRGHRGEAVFVSAALIAIPVVYAWPLVHRMPVALVRAEGTWAALGRMLNFPPLHPPPAALPVHVADIDALAARGHYVATIGSCSLCHTAGPSVTRPTRAFPAMGGGMRVNWSVFGTVYSRNLTPDRETGLGAWSDAEITRAITSGLTRDGRVLHWQAMPWDHFSHLTLEDLEALVVYLRRLPPRRVEIPPSSPPAPGDQAGAAFGFGFSGRWTP